MYLEIIRKLDLQKFRLSPSILVFFLTLLLSGCASVYKPNTHQITIHLTTSDELSSSHNNLHQPIAVKIYELKGSAIFKYADYLTLHEFAEEALGPDFISEQELKLIPNSEKVLTITPSPQTKYIAVMASYKNIQNTVWRQVIPTYSFENKHQSFIFSKSGITLLDDVLIGKKTETLPLLSHFGWFQ